MSRRLFLGLVCLSPLTMAGPLRALAGPAREGTVERAAGRLARLLPAGESAAVVGREYLRGAPLEADVRVLVEALCSSQPEPREVFLQKDAGRLREWFRCQRRLDFESGRTVKVDGWILSATEARVCALRALV